jgi:tRNA A37 threonylcarbamoyladenosine synthetase subunit TsaC/SUA5/YrdC
MSSSLILPGQEDPLTDPLEMRDLLEKQVDLIIDGGFCGLQSTSVINLEDDQVEILREGCGDLTLFGG